MNRLNFKQLAPQLSDENLLIALAEGGEEEALKEFYQRHSGKVLGYCLKKGFPKESAEEVLQIVFLQLWRKRTNYSPQYKALAWLYTITQSEAKDYLNRDRTQKKVKDSFAEETRHGLSQRTELAPSIHEVSVSLDALSPSQKEVIQKRFFEDQEFSEIAKALGQSEASVRKVISRALQVLRLQTARRKE